MKTYILVHGAFHGGWCWQRVAERLRRAGHTVFTPTQTGLGERSHLLSADVGLDIFIRDIVNVFEFEDLTDVVLVGHSFGGVAIAGAADRLADRIRHMVYLDSTIPQNGQSVFEGLPPSVVEERLKLARAHDGGLSLPAYAPEYFGVTDPADVRWLASKLTPHPLKTYTDKMRLNHPVANGLPRTFIRCTSPIYTPINGFAAWAREQSDWDWKEIATGHDAMITASAELTAMLESIG